VSPQLNPGRLLPRALLRFPDAAAGPFVGAVRGASDDQLRQAMAFAPLRRAVLEAIFRQMPRYLDRRRAKDVRLRVRWEITRPGAGRPDVYELAIENGRARVSRGTGPAVGGPVDVTIIVDGAKFLRLVSGTADPMRAYLDGDLAGTGDIMAAARMVSLFRMPGTRSDRRSGQTPV
jgi:hypothetical protein